MIRQTLEQGQNRLRYIMELKEKVVLSTEPQGIIKIEEDTENLKQEFDKLSNKIQVSGIILLFIVKYYTISTYLLYIFKK